jgi:hypothetical protein
MKRNILLVADGDIESDLDIVDAATRTTHGVCRTSTHSRPSQILRRNLKNIDAVIVDLDERSQALTDSIPISDVDWPRSRVVKTASLAPILAKAIHGGKWHKNLQ